MTNIISPNWPAAKRVWAFTTTRQDGYSKGAYASFNLSYRTGDDDEAVTKNRLLLKEKFKLPNEPFWLKQQHTDIALRLDVNSINNEPIADATFTQAPGIVCVAMTADCVPVLVCDQDATIVAAIHAGWKGIAGGVIEATIKAMSYPDNSKLLAWLGPAIGPTAFEVGPEVKATFTQHDPAAAKAFIQNGDKLLANIYLLATQRLQSAGVTAIYGGEYCTYTQPELFFSYRREGEKSGRMASVVWLEPV